MWTYNYYNLDDIADWASGNIDIMWYLPQMMKSIKPKVVGGNKLVNAFFIPPEMATFKREKFIFENDLLYEDYDKNMDESD